MDIETVRRCVLRLGRHAFASFMSAIFEDASRERNGAAAPLRRVDGAGEDAFYVPYWDSYGESVHCVYLLHFPPLELFRPSIKLEMRDPVLMRPLAKIRNMYHGRIGQMGMVDPFLRKTDALASIAFVTNLSGLQKTAYDDLLIPAYQRLKRFCGLKRPSLFVGSCDSFLENSPERVVTVFEEFMRRHSDGLTIQLSECAAVTAEFTTERNLGATVASELPYEPVFVNTVIGQRAKLDEFDRLLASVPSERRLEEFLTANYQVLFGSKYDRIETQLWLRFPDLDIGQRSRRLDVFLRNSVTNDWHLFEIKRPIALTRTIRDVPVITQQVMEAIHQIKNYARLLSQDRVKRYFADSGIEYFEPSLTVVIGRTPEIPLQQWRWLKSENEGRVSIVTFDELRAELACRLEERYSLVSSMNAPNPGGRSHAFCERPQARARG